MILEKIGSILPFKSYDSRLLSGALIAVLTFSAVLVGIGHLSGLPLTGRAIVIISLAGTASLVMSAVNYRAVVKQMSEEFDERTSLYFLKANNFSEQIAGTLLIIWASYEYAVHDKILWPVIIILAIATIARSIAFLYLKRTQ